MSRIKNHIESTRPIKTSTVLVLCLVLAFIVALLSGTRSNGDKEFNDTAQYFEHFSCLSQGMGIESCDNLISTNSFEFLYQYLAYLFSAFSDFGFFKFAFAFLVSFAILFGVQILSNGLFYGTTLLLLDFRFWEFFTNVLRLGFAIGLFIFCFAFLIKSKWRNISIFAHISMLPLIFAPTRKLSNRTISLLFLFAVSSWFFADVWAPVVLEYFNDDSKLRYYYLTNENIGIQVPLHYFAFTITSIFFYKKSEDPIYVATSNIMYLLMAAVLFLDVFGLSYRISAIMLPFVVVSVCYQVRYFSRLFVFGRSIICFFAKTAVFFVFFAGFLKNLDVISMHLR